MWNLFVPGVKYKGHNISYYPLLRIYSVTRKIFKSSCTYSSQKVESQKNFDDYLEDANKTGSSGIYYLIANMYELISALENVIL